MEGRVIPEPQRAYLLELLNALGPAAEDFVVAGAQALKFAVEKARTTKDVDFVLNVLALRKEPLQLAPVFEKLGYKPVPESRNFQFEKPIPGSAEKMRIEFMAPDEYKREKDFRVDIQDGVHARACAGGSIALVQSDLRKVSGVLSAHSRNFGLRSQLRSDDSDHAAPLLVEFDVFADRGDRAKETLSCGSSENAHRRGRGIFRAIEETAFRDAEMADLQITWLSAVNYGSVLLRFWEKFSWSKPFARRAFLDVGNILSNDLIVVERQAR